jgi:hypothetical protein
MVLNAPGVKEYIEAQHSIGNTDYLNRMSEMILGAADASAFSDYTRNMYHVGDNVGEYGAKKQLDEKPKGDPSLNPWSIAPNQTKKNIVVNSDGSITFNQDNPEYQKLNEELNTVNKAIGSKQGNIKGDDPLYKEQSRLTNEIEKYKVNVTAEDVNILREQYPHLDDQGLANLVANVNSSQQMYIEQMTDQNGNPLPGELRSVNDFANLEIYSASNGYKKISFEDVLEKSKQSVDGEGKVLQQGIDILPLASKPDPNNPDKEQFDFSSGIPFTINGELFIATEGTKQKSEINSRLGYLYGQTSDLGVDSENKTVNDIRFATIPMQSENGYVEQQGFVSKRVVDDNGKPTVLALPAHRSGQNIVLAIPGYGEVVVDPKNESVDPVVGGFLPNATSRNIKSTDDLFLQYGKDIGELKKRTARK